MNGKILGALTAAAVLSGFAAQAQAETMLLREISVRTFSSTLHDEKNHPVLQIDDLKKPSSIGEGRGAGGWVFLNNKVFDWESNKELGWMRGACFTVDHGPAGAFKGEVVIGAGGPFDASCQLSYVLPDGQVVANGNLNLTDMEKDKVLSLPVTGGTGKYAGARGEVVINQDPPGQPIAYKVTIKYTK